MGNWRPYHVGDVRLGQLNGEAVAVWWEHDATGRRQRRRFRLDVRTEAEGRLALERFCRRRDAAQAAAQSTVSAIWSAYVADRERDGKGMAVYHHNWKALAPVFGSLSPAE